MDAAESYERLEFLGDAVLELVISDHLYGLLEDSDEGQLTKARSSLVRGKVLAAVARRLGLGELLLVGHGVEASRGREQDSVLAATLEAVIAAIYLDQGLEAARRFISEQLAPELSDITQRGAPPENPKSRLQELLQGQGQPTPSYRLVGREGPDHNPVFSVEAVVGEQVIGTGQGGKKSDAERAAAEAALDRLLSINPVYQTSGGEPSSTPSANITPVEPAKHDESNSATGLFKRFRLNRKS
jgi:ribonuclease-3